MNTRGKFYITSAFAKGSSSITGPLCVALVSPGLTEDPEEVEEEVEDVEIEADGGVDVLLG